MGVIQNVFRARAGVLAVKHTVVGAPRRAEAEAFIARVFRNHYAAELHSFAPNLMLFERGRRILAAAGWRAADGERLFLESYLDGPVEEIISRLAGHAVPRERIVEVGNLAVAQRGASVDVIFRVASHLDRLGYEWAVFTATAELIGVLRRLGLPPLALAPADPGRLGDRANDWGSYYDSRPVVVAGRIRLALDRAQHCG